MKEKNNNLKLKEMKHIVNKSPFYQSKEVAKCKETAKIKVWLNEKTTVTVKTIEAFKIWKAIYPQAKLI